MLVLLCCLSALLQSTASASIRGASPSLRSLYDVSTETFQCLDGSKTFSRSRVNDEYCDCADGSDEPDCCDGTDEQQGCKNTCKQAGSAARQELVSKTKEYASGAKVRQKYISQFHTSKQAWQQDLDKVNKDLGPQQELVEKAKAEKEAAEKVEREQKAAEQAAKKVDQDAVKLEDTVNTGDQSILQDTAESDISNDPLAANAAAAAIMESKEEDAVAAAGRNDEEDQDLHIQDAPQTTAAVNDVIQPDQTVNTGSQHVLKEAAEEEEKELTPDEMGRKIASQWTTDPEAADSTQSSTPAPAADTAEEVGLNSATAALEGAASYFAGEPSLESLTENIKARAAAMLDLGKGWVSKTLGSSVRPSGQAEGGTQVKTLQDKYFKHNSRLTELQGQQRDLEAKLKHDYGPEGVFGALVDKCYDTKVDKYTYSICPFKDAHQKENAMKTSLGNWAGFEENYTVMKFTGGQGCWQGPARSMTVSVACGSAEKLSKVQEPSRCEYVAELLTPAACTPESAQALQSKLTALDSDADDEHIEL